MRITQNGWDYWLHIDAPSGNKASINLGPRNRDNIIDRVIREVAQSTMVRCDKWGAPGCLGESCPGYSDHEYDPVLCNGSCPASQILKCIPNAPGWAAEKMRLKHCEHPEDLIAKRDK